MPYLLMLVASLVPLAIYFYTPAYNVGDDSTWHLIYSYDLVYGFEHGFFGTGPGHLLMGSLGYDVFLFYAPFPHYLAAWLKYLFSWAGSQITVTLKFISWLSIYFSGIVTYKLGKKIVGDWKIALAAALLFIFYPYRIMNFLYRAAYCESVAIGFIPLLFYGVYSLLHDEQFRISSYIATILGISLLVLSHPFTALVSCLAAGIFAVCNPKKLVNYLKKKTTWVALPISVLLIFGLISFYFFPMLQALNTGYYRMSYPYSVQTNVEYLIKALDGSFRLSGFLDFGWLDYAVNSGWTLQGDSAALWALSIFFFGCASALAIFLLSHFRKKGKSMYGLPAAVVVMLLPLFVVNRQEMVLGTIVFILGLIIYEFTEDEKELGFDEMKREAVSLAKNPYIYGLCAIIVIIQLFLWTDWIWEISPSIFRNAQFPFRWWSIFSFILVLATIFLWKPFKGKRVAAESLLAISILFYIGGMGPVNKRIANINGYGFAEEPSFSTMENLTRVGVSNEYTPEVFYQSGYASQYDSSLYRYVRNILRNSHDWDFTAEEYRTAFLLGSGSIEVTKLDSPSVDLTIVANEDSLIQLAQFYYDGYAVYLTSSSGETSTVTPSYVDGLLAFEVPEGEYEAELRYVGTISYNVSVPFFFISSGLLILLPIGAEVLKRRKRKAGEQEEPAEKAAA